MVKVIEKAYKGRYNIYKIDDMQKECCISILKNVWEEAEEKTCQKKWSDYLRDKMIKHCISLRETEELLM